MEKPGGNKIRVSPNKKSTNLMGMNVCLIHVKPISFFFNLTVWAKIILVHPKCKITFSALSNCSLIHYCSSNRYHSSNFLIANVVALYIFALFSVLVKYISWLVLFCIVLSIVIALPTIALLKAIAKRNGNFLLSPTVMARKSENYK